jgi:hypothetical protein
MEKAEPPFRARCQPGSDEPTQARQLLLLASVGFNLGLLLLLAFLCIRREFFSSAPLRNSPVAKKPTLTIRPRHSSARNVLPSPWSQMESTDLTVYASNLRAAGCPAKTVRDILLPLIEQKFEHAESPIPDPTNFWASFSERRAVAAARAEQQSQLAQEKYKLLEEVFGFDWLSPGIKEAYNGDAAASLGFLDYEDAEKFLCVAERFRSEFVRVADSCRDDIRSSIYETWREKTAEVLSPQEFEEAELRALLMIYQRRNPNLCNAGLTGGELRQLMIFRREVCKPLPSALLAGRDEFLEEPGLVAEQQFNAEARGLLGDSRFIDYLKSCDRGIERTIAALEKEHFSRDLALQLFDLREQALVRAQQIRQLPIRRAEKRAQLSALRQNAAEQLATLSDPTTESPVLRVNEDWLQEIASP